MNKAKQNNGFTIVELMVAMVIGVVLAGGLIQVFQGSKKSYGFTEELGRLQENGRYALDLLTYDIRMIGYQGCADPESIITTVLADPPPANSASVSGLDGFKVTSSSTITPSALPTIYTDGATITNNAGQFIDVSSLALANTDIIMMQYTSPTGISLSGNLAPNNANVQIGSNPNKFDQDSVVIISDCETADIFRVTNNVSATCSGCTLTHSNSSNNGAYNSKLSKIYGTDALVLSFQTNLYFIAPSGLDKDTSLTRTNKRGDNINSLYRVNIKDELDELVQGVDAMVFQYGEELADGNVRYMSADAAGLNMARVTSIKIGLLMHSIEGITEADDTRTYNVAGTNYDDTTAPTYANDNRMRRVFTATVNLRNRR